MRHNDRVMQAMISLIARGGETVCEEWMVLDSYEKVFMMRALTHCVQIGKIKVDLPKSLRGCAKIARRAMDQRTLRLIWKMSGPSVEVSSTGQIWERVYGEIPVTFQN